jgi:hypothetical protein
MSVAHNLSSIASNLSGFDPAAEIEEGTPVGRSWLLWKIFEELATFDINIKKITNAAPTPAWLQGEVGANLQTEPSLDRASNGDSIKFYMTNDPGLAKTPPSAIIYEWRMLMSLIYYGLFTVRVRHLISGGTAYGPGADGIIVSGQSTPIAEQAYEPPFPSTTTAMVNIPKIIFWKSNNANLMMAIGKDDASYRGYLCWLNPSVTGYRHNIGAVTEGMDARSTIFMNANKGCTFIEPFSETYNGSLNSLVTGLSPLNSAGSMPTGLFTFSGRNNLMAGKLRFGILNNSALKLISAEIDGIILANPTAANFLAGQIYQYNNNYYLHGNTINDGREDHKVLFLLGT